MFDRLNAVEKKIEILEKKIIVLESLSKMRLQKKKRDDKWDEFLRIVILQERHQNRIAS